MNVMKNYKEWSNLLQKEDPKNPFSALYEYEDGSVFYVEPIFYTQLQEFQQHYPDSLSSILEEMERIVKMNHKVVFTGDYEAPFTQVEDAVYLEIFDITNRLQLFVEDKSRGSDYGD